MNKEQIQKEKANMESALQQVRSALSEMSKRMETLRNQELLQIGAIQGMDHLLSLLEPKAEEPKKDEEAKQEQSSEAKEGQ